VQLFAQFLDLLFELLNARFVVLLGGVLRNARRRPDEAEQRHQQPHA
jgi:hypothetical protein